MSRWRKRPVEVDAVQWTGDNEEEIERFCAGAALAYDRVSEPGDPARALLIDTLEGSMCASPGDWIIRGVRSEFYPCKPDIFTETYEPVEN